MDKKKTLKSYYEMSVENELQWLERQKKFLLSRINGLSESIRIHIENKKKIPSSLKTAYRKYFEAQLSIDDRIRMLEYIEYDITLTSDLAEAIDNA